LTGSGRAIEILVDLWARVPDQRPPVAVSREEATCVPLGSHTETDDEYPPRWSFALTVGVEPTANQFVIGLPP